MVGREAGQHAVVLVTGATDGIGRETARALVARGFHVLVHGRSGERAAEAARAVALEAGEGVAEPVAADLSSFREVRALAADVRRRTDRLHLLVNNAGVYRPHRTLTENGLETTFAVNHLAPFLLTNLLLDLLATSAPARVVTVSSGAHQSAELDFGNLQGEKHYQGYAAYALSKLANIMFTVELAERLRGSRVTANSLHPGVVETKLLRGASVSMRGAPVAEGAATIIFVATDPSVASVSGCFFVGRQAVPPSEVARDRALAAKLWKVSERLASLA